MGVIQSLEFVKISVERVHTGASAEERASGFRPEHARAKNHHVRWGDAGESGEQHAHAAA
jgi:hypothetical protein